MASTTQKADQNVQEGRLGSMPTTTNAGAAIRQQRSRVVSVRVAADSAANSNLAEQHLAGLLEFAGQVTDLRISVETNVAATGATNYAVVTIQSRDDANGSALTVGKCNTAVSGALTAYVSSQLVLTKNQLALTALSKLTIKHDKFGASPPQLPAYTITATVLDT